MAPTKSRAANAFKVAAKSNTSSSLDLIVNSPRMKLKRYVKIQNLTGYMFTRSKRPSQNTSK